MNGLITLLAERCPGLGLADTEAASVRAGLGPPRTEAMIVYRPDRTEIARRQAAGLTGVTRVDQLDQMMDLPAGLPVPHASLSAAARRAVQRFPSGCVEHTAAGVVRRLVPPVDVRLAVVTRVRFAEGLVRAGRFAPYCARVLALAGTPTHLQEAAAEADFWGVGLIVNAAGTPELMVAPAPFQRWRHTPAGWGFAEDIYRQAVQARSAA